MDSFWENGKKSKNGCFWAIFGHFKANFGYLSHIPVIRFWCLWARRGPFGCRMTVQNFMKIVWTVFEKFEISKKRSGGTKRHDWISSWKFSPTPKNWLTIDTTRSWEGPIKKQQQENIGATACRAWARAETFKGLQKVLQILRVPEPTTLWTYPNSDEDILTKELKRWRKNFFEKNEKCIFGRNLKASYFLTETLILQKVAFILASRCEGEWFSYLFQFWEKSATNWKIGKNSTKFFHYFVC